MGFPRSNNSQSAIPCNNHLLESKVRLFCWWVEKKHKPSSSVKNLLATWARPIYVNLLVGATVLHLHMNSRVASIQANPRITRTSGWAYQRCNTGEGERGREGGRAEKPKERIENERRSCCSLALCFTGRAQEVWVTRSKINTLTQQRADGRAAHQKAHVDPRGPATRGGLVGVTTKQKKKTQCSSPLIDRCYFYFFTISTSSNEKMSTPLSFRPLCPVRWFTSLPIPSAALCSPSYFIWSQSIGVLSRTRWLPPGSVRPLADCCRRRCCPDAAPLSQAQAPYCVCPECAHCRTHLLYCTSLRGTFPHPSFLCPLFLILRGSDGKVVEGRGGGGGERPGNKTSTVAMIDRKVALHGRDD